MMTQEERMDLIESYLNDRMSSEEQASFESEMARDQELRGDVAAHRKAHHAIAHLNRKELKQKLQSIDAEELRNEGGSRVRRLVVGLSIAASIVLIVGLGFLFTTDYFDQSNSLADLSEEFFVPTNPESFRGKDVPNKTSYADQLVQADLLYQNGDFDGAIIEYEQLSQVSNTLQDRAEWNLVLSYLLSESHQVKCDALLDIIAADKTHLYHERALRLREKL